MVLIMPKGQSIDAYFGQADSHNHTFGGCVFTEYYDGDRNGAQIVKRLPEAERLGFVRDMFLGMTDSAVKRGVKHLVVSEHPQFRDFVPFPEYWDIFSNARRRSRSKGVLLTSGLELNIKRNAENRVYVDVDEIGYRNISSFDILGKVNVLVAGIHDKHFREDSPIVDADDYLRVCLAGIDSLSELGAALKEEGRGEKVLIFAHPWDAAGRANADPKRKPEEGLKRITYFNEDHLKSLSSRLLETGVRPEINVQSTTRNYSDFRWHEPAAPRSIVEVYIAYCMRRRELPIISIASDSHSPSGVGDLPIDRIKKCIPNLDRAVLWNEAFANERWSL
jgi:hypothetical protein